MLLLEYFYQKQVQRHVFNTPPLPLKTAPRYSMTAKPLVQEILLPYRKEQK